MRVLLHAVFVCAALLCILPAAQANVMTYTPPAGSTDLGDLNHNWYYSWGISLGLPTGTSIQSATLYIDNINNWRQETNDALYIRLLDDPALGVKAEYDGQTVRDQWRWSSINLSQQVHSEYGTDRPLLRLPNGDDYYHDNTAPYGDVPGGDYLVYTFDSTLLTKLNAFAKNNGVVGFGFDPDCHYFNSGVRFEISTQSPTPATAIPEPFTVLLGSVGLSIIGAVRRIRGK